MSWKILDSPQAATRTRNMHVSELDKTQVPTKLLGSLGDVVCQQTTIHLADRRIDALYRVDSHLFRLQSLVAV